MNGIIILDKPSGFTSFDAVAVLRGLSRQKKIGHTGTLDPMATGVLPVLLGRAAKALNFLPDTDKEYQAAFRLGERRDTGDVTGEVVETSPNPVPLEELERVLPQFRGEIDQVPPMYSAVSVGGKRLYELARKGLEVDRPARQVTISALELRSYDPETREGILRVSCSKGTYIRTLIEDLARAAGSCGTMTALRRTRACGFGQEEARSLEELKALAGEGRLEEVLFPVERLFSQYPEVTVSAAQARRFENGGGLDLVRVRKAPREGLCRVKSPEGEFLGLGKVDREQGELGFVKSFVERGE